MPRWRWPRRSAAARTQFAAMMNRTAQRMGLKDTNFLNSSGYFEGPAPNHYSTARDLARLAAALIRDHPETHALHAMKEYTYNGIRQHNRNRLLWADPTVDGLKTGHSSAAGFCLIATARRGPRRLISVVLGTASEEARARIRSTCSTGASRPSTPVKLYDKGQAISQLGCSRARRTPGRRRLRRGLRGLGAARHGRQGQCPTGQPAAAARADRRRQPGRHAQAGREWPALGRVSRWWRRRGTPRRWSSAACGTTSGCTSNDGPHLPQRPVAARRKRPASRSWIAASSSATACMR
jgi:hypothetical protein